jgi:hypothetical protein
MSKNVNFTPAEILSIRADYAAGRLSPKAWADAKDCSPETIRRIARGETHRNVGGQAGPAFGGLGQVGTAPDSDASDAELAASFARLTGALAAPDTADSRIAEASALVDSLRAKARGAE